MATQEKSTFGYSGKDYKKFTKWGWLMLISFGFVKTSISL